MKWAKTKKKRPVPARISKGSTMTWTSAFGRASGWLLDRIVHGLALTRISLFVFFFFGFVINIVAAYFFGKANATNAGIMFFNAGCVIFGTGLFDMVDGRVARKTNQVTVFGSFFDSVIDRYSDVVLFFGLLVYYGRINRFRYVVLVAFVMVTSLMVSYTRARAEALIGSCKVGFLERPERIVQKQHGTHNKHKGVMAPVLWVLAVLSTITVFHRIQYTYQYTKNMAPISE